MNRLSGQPHLARLETPIGDTQTVVGQRLKKKRHLEQDNTDQSKRLKKISSGLQLENRVITDSPNKLRRTILRNPMDSEFDCISQFVRDTFKLTSYQLQTKVQEKLVSRSMAIAQIAFELADQRLLKSDPLEEEEIRKIYHLFFATKIREHIPVESLPIDPLRPHPARIFQNLYACFGALSSYNTCDEALEQSGKHHQSKPKPIRSVEILLKAPRGQRERVLQGFRDTIDDFAQQIEDGVELLGEKQTKFLKSKDFITSYETFLENVETHREGYKNFPMIRAADFTGHETMHESYFLNADNTFQWIFKPFLREEASLDHNLRGMAKREHTASLVNFHHQFPIPLSIYINIKGWIGSAQLFVPNTHNVTQVQSREGIVFQRDLQKILLFDLLFYNTNRHLGNLLLSETAETSVYQAYGTDHDFCFQEPGSKPIKIDCSFLLDINLPLEADLIDLVSLNSRQEYERRMQIHSIPKENIEWMNQSAAFIENAIEQQTPITGIIEYLFEKAETGFD